MDLILGFVLAYVWQSSVSVPADTVVVKRRVGGWREISGGGLRVLSLVPSSASLVPLGEGADALSIAAFREAFGSARRAVRWLGACCDLYLIAILAGLPLLLAIGGDTLAIFRGLPLIALLHLACFALLVHSARRFDPARTGGRFELLLSCLLYPPAMLRAPQDLVRGQLSPFHRMTVRGALLDRAVFADHIRSALACLAREHSIPRRRRAKLTRQELLALAADRGLGLPELESPRPRTDPTAASYCPVCFAEYREGFWSCVDCQIGTVGYAS